MTYDDWKLKSYYDNDPNDKEYEVVLWSVHSVKATNKEEAKQLALEEIRYYDHLEVDDIAEI